MELFGTNYLKLRNQYVIPLIHIGIKRSNYKYWLFKDVLTTKIVSLNHIGRKDFSIELYKEDFYKGLYCDIQLYFSKSIVHYTDFLNTQLSSGCWGLVTLYYLSFFASTTLYRFMQHGSIFLDESYIKRLEDYYLIINSTPIKLETGNYYFEFVGENPKGDVELRFYHKGKNVHQNHWNYLRKFLVDSIPNCDSDEKVIYKHLISLFDKFSTEFQSTLRNKLNYRGESAIWELEKRINKIDFIFLNDNFVKLLINQNLSKTDNNYVQATGIVCVFLFKYILQLIEDLSTRSTFGNDFIRERKKFLELKKCKIPNF